MGRATIAVWLALSIAATASGARAQASVIISQESGCIPLGGCGNAGTPCTGPDGVPSTCVEVLVEGITTLLCRPDVSAFCCTADGVDCPTGSTCHADVVGLVDVCLRDTNDYCEAEPDQARIEKCHTSPSTLFPVDYDDGDCDGDGVSNRAEADSVTDPCVAPPAVVGVWIDAGGDIACHTPIATCESVGRSCSSTGLPGTCQRDERTGEAAPLCAPSPAVFCCGGASGAVCPALACVLPSDRPGVAGVCADAALLCATDEASLRACHTSPAGIAPVAYADGDCDGDGADNASELRSGSDPCAEARDAGATMDAGTRATVEPTFAGGGGARCAIARGRDRGAVGLVLLAAIAIFALRRRR